jgi:signal transduction histidine kinase
MTVGRAGAGSIAGSLVGGLERIVDRWILAATVAFGALTEGVKLTSGFHSLGSTASGAALALAFVASGLLVRRRAPENRVGMLLILVGFCLLAEDLVTARTPLLYTAGSLVHAVSGPALAWLVLAYPSGRLDDRRLRVVVIVAWVSAVLTGGVFWASYPGGAGGQESLLVIANEPTMERVADAAATVFVAGIAAVCAAVLAWRWRASSRPARRVLAPFLAAGLALAVVFAVEALPRAHAGWLGVTPPFRAVELLVTAALPFAALAGIARLELARSDATEQVLALGPSASVAAVRDALSRALADPSLGILATDSGRGGLLDEAGRRVEHAREPAAAVALGGQRPLGLLVLDPALRQDQRLVDVVAGLAAEALDHQRAEQDAAGHDARSRAALADAVAVERRRIERDLHDGVQQRLVAMALWFDVLAANLGDARTDRAREVINRMSLALDGAIAELRELTHGAPPAVLINEGLDLALAALVERTPDTIALHGRAGAGVPPTVAAAGYFAAAEGITNAVRHSRAGAIELEVAREGDRLLIEVRDDGIGGARLDGGSGLRGLADRLAELGGGLTLESPPGAGTRLRFELPASSVV